MDYVFFFCYLWKGSFSWHPFIYIYQNYSYSSYDDQGSLLFKLPFFIFLLIINLIESPFYLRTTPYVIKTMFYIHFSSCPSLLVDLNNWMETCFLQLIHKKGQYSFHCNLTFMIIRLKWIYTIKIYIICYISSTLSTF